MKKSKMVLLVEKLLNQGTSTSAHDTGIANANQYYVELERLGITSHRWVYKDGSKYKERFIKDRAKAHGFLAKQTKKTPQANEA